MICWPQVFLSDFLGAIYSFVPLLMPQCASSGARPCQLIILVLQPAVALLTTHVKKKDPHMCLFSSSVNQGFGQGESEPAGTCESAVSLLSKVKMVKVPLNIFCVQHSFCL